ncbi:MAG: pyruvate kinase [Chlamydiota bacterium]|nr:pyruvate kinase [Chlamydiota bacterium]
MATRTKIVCTIGPATGSYEKVHALIDVGMQVARLNMSHGSHADHARAIGWLHAARRERQIPLPILLDTQGPEVRLFLPPKQGKIMVHPGDYIQVVKEPACPGEMKLTPHHIIEELPEGALILFDDGKISGRWSAGHRVEIKEGGELLDGKGVNFPHVALSLPAITAQDGLDIDFGLSQGIEGIAASFIRSADHVIQVRNRLKKAGHPDCWIIAKLESALGVHAMQEILEVADGLMVARGDLGVELPLKTVPRLQKEMIRRGYHAFKPVITATQMLESMIYQSQPTRAEVSDVANAIYDGSGGVMLSGETAVGAFPMKATEIMRQIVKETEEDLEEERPWLRERASESFSTTPPSVALTSVQAAYSCGASAFIVLTTGGTTARLVAGFRPQLPILAITAHEHVYHQLGMVWGVIPLLAEIHGVGEGMRYGIDHLQKKGYVKRGERVVITAGGPVGREGTTNMLRIEVVE